MQLYMRTDELLIIRLGVAEGICVVVIATGNTYELIPNASQQWINEYWSRLWFAK